MAESWRFGAMRAARGWRLAAMIAAAMALSSCVPEPLLAPFEAADLRPPAVVSWGPVGQSAIAIAFDEEVAEALPCFATSNGPPVDSVELGSDGKSVSVTLGGASVPGVAYAVSGTIADRSGNRSSFVLPYWGFNPEPPRMVINELLTEGSSTHPDAVEFAVVEGGDCAGLAFYVGYPADRDLRFVFPPLRVSAGDFVVLHLKPQGLPEELDESTDQAASGGIDASTGAWDLWFREGPGALSGANGLLTLYRAPNGEIIDAVAYSERFSDSDEKYDGFGSAAFRDRVAFAAASGAWKASQPPRPEDCARSEGTTSTRTICRASDSGDSDGRDDWHIVPTRGSTLGAPNKDEVYEP